MQRALAVVVVVLLAAGVVAVAAHDRSATTNAPATTGPSQPVTTEIVLRPDQARVTGTLDSATFDGASAPALHLPVTIAAGTRGSTRARITGARQEGRDVTVTWDGGQPLPVSGTGSIDVVGAHLEVRPDGFTWSLDGDPRPLLPGHYELGATVAVGTSGLATPRDSTSFDAGPSCQLSTVNGATVHVPPGPLHLDGPGTLDVRGRFQIETAAGTHAVTRVRFGPGSFVADLAPVAGGWQLQLLAEGPLTEG